MNPPVENKGKQKVSKGGASSESAEDTAAILARAAAKKRKPDTVPPKAEKGSSSDKTQPVDTESSTVSHTSSQATSEPKSEAKLSKRIQRTYANMIQKSVTATVTADQSFGLAVVVKSIDSNLREPKLRKESITYLTQKSPEKLNQLICSAIGDFCNQFVQLDSESTDKKGFDANKVLRESFGYIMENNADDPRDLAGVEEAKKAVIIESWTPNKDLLEMFTTTQLAIISNDSGFEQAYNDIHKSETAWATYINKHRKDEVIAEILKTSFDWSGFAPKNYIELGLSYSTPL